MLSEFLVLEVTLTSFDVAVKRNSVQDVLFYPVEFHKLFGLTLIRTFVLATVGAMDGVASLAFPSVNGNVLASFTDEVLKDLLHVDLVGAEVVFRDIDFVHMFWFLKKSFS